MCASPASYSGRFERRPGGGFANGRGSGGDDPASGDGEKGGGRRTSIAFQSQNPLMAKLKSDPEACEVGAPCASRARTDVGPGPTAHRKEGRKRRICPLSSGVCVLLPCAASGSAIAIARNARRFLCASSSTE